jgi:hypothetical protein
MTKQQMTKHEFKTQWMRAQEEIADLVYRGIALQNIMPSLYEGVLGEPAPRYEPRLHWDDDDEAVAS